MADTMNGSGRREPGAKKRPKIAPEKLAKYAQIPAEVLSNPDLTSDAVRVYCVLLRFDLRKDGVVWPKNETIAELAGNMSESRVDRAIKNLADTGFISSELAWRDRAGERVHQSGPGRERTSATRTLKSVVRNGKVQSTRATETASTGTDPEGVSTVYDAKVSTVYDAKVSTVYAERIRVNRKEDVTADGNESKTVLRNCAQTRSVGAADARYRKKAWPKTVAAEYLPEEWEPNDWHSRDAARYGINLDVAVEGIRRYGRVRRSRDWDKDFGGFLKAIRDDDCYGPKSFQEAHPEDSEWTDWLEDLRAVPEDQPAEPPW